MCLAADTYVYWFNNGDPGGTTRYRHAGKANMAAADGSARSVRKLSAYGWEVMSD